VTDQFLAKGSGCWNSFDPGNGSADGDAKLIIKDVDLVSLLRRWTARAQR
jgi:hypothetical protein